MHYAARQEGKSRPWCDLNFEVSPLCAASWVCHAGACAMLAKKTCWQHLLKVRSSSLQCFHHRNSPLKKAIRSIERYSDSFKEGTWKNASTMCVCVGAARQCPPDVNISQWLSRAEPLWNSDIGWALPSSTTNLPPGIPDISSRLKTPCGCGIPKKPSRKPSPGS